MSSRVTECLSGTGCCEDEYPTFYRQPKARSWIVRSFTKFTRFLFALFIALITPPLVVVLWLLRWTVFFALIVDGAYQFGRMCYYFDNPHVHATWMFLLHYCVIVFIFLFNRRLGRLYPGKKSIRVLPDLTFKGLL
jgi:hypothetical protein